MCSSTVFRTEGRQRLFAGLLAGRNFCALYGDVKAFFPPKIVDSKSAIFCAKCSFLKLSVRTSKKGEAVFFLAITSRPLVQSTLYLVCSYVQTRMPNIVFEIFILE